MRALRAALAAHPARVWLYWLVGTAVLVATTLALADPAVLVLVADPELVALMVMAGIGVLRATAVGRLTAAEDWRRRAVDWLRRLHCGP